MLFYLSVSLCNEDVDEGAEYYRDLGCIITKVLSYLSFNCSQEITAIKIK